MVTNFANMSDQTIVQNSTWFSGEGMTVHNARKILKRKTEGAYVSNNEICGNIYSQYFNFKLDKVLHVTKREGRQTFHDCFNRQGYYLLKQIFRPHFLSVMKNEIVTVPDLEWSFPPAFHNQVQSTQIGDPDDHEGCKFLQHFLHGISAGTFTEKIYYDVTLLRTVLPKRKKKWIDCDFHQDCSDPPSQFLDNPRSPITLYFSLEKDSVNLDVIPKKQTSGPAPGAHTIKLESGDILLFDPCRTSHRTSKPKKTSVPDRVNIVMTGFKEYIDVELLSNDEVDSQATISE